MVSWNKVCLYFRKALSHFQNTFSLWCGSYDLWWKSQGLHKQTCYCWSQALRVELSCVRVTWSSHKRIKISMQFCISNKCLDTQWTDCCKKNKLMSICPWLFPSTPCLEAMVIGCQVCLSTASPVISANLLTFWISVGNCYLESDDPNIPKFSFLKCKGINACGWMLYI